MGWTAEEIEPGVWRERFYIRGCYWVPPKRYESDDDSPISIHFEVFRCWKIADDSLRFYPANGLGATEPQEDFLYISGSVKWDGCSNWDFGDGFGHFCSATEAFETGELFAHLYEEARGFFDPMYEDEFLVEGR